MSAQPDIKLIHSKIQLMQTTADELKQMADDFPALDRNLVRLENRVCPAGSNRPFTPKIRIC